MLPTDTVPTCHVVPEGVYTWTAEMPLQWFHVWKELAAANTEERHPWAQAVEDVAGSETQAVKQPTLEFWHQDLDRESMKRLMHSIVLCNLCFFFFLPHMSLTHCHLYPSFSFLSLSILSPSLIPPSFCSGCH